MGVNDCSGYSHGHCAAKLLGRFSFRPLFENPMLGPSASTCETLRLQRYNDFETPKVLDQQLEQGFIFLCEQWLENILDLL